MKFEFNSIEEVENFAIRLGYTKGDGWKPVPETTSKTKPVTQADIQKDNKEKQKENSNGKAITLEDIRAKGAKLVEGGKTDTMKAILTKHGAKKIGELKEADYDKVFEAFTKAL